ncbi:MAG: lasso peptide biosynthesis B2 protein [Brevundimonas sp.]|nr:lasso peptide biosynthesis B2 protein [Brevundimonas sp.]
MSIQLWPVADVHLAAVEEDIILLNVGTDSYDCLPGAATWLTLCDDGSILAADEVNAKALQAAELVTVTPPAHPRRRPAVARQEFSVATGATAFRAIAAAMDLAEGTLAFRRKTFAQLVSEAAGQIKPRATTEADLRLVLAAYRTALPWIPFEGECLQRAFLLRRFLARRGIRTDWVFGVRTWPFGAHCWLQLDDQVIGDSLARVTAYTPIMAA